jgi:uracil-DNA glycosylase family 4
MLDLQSQRRGKRGKRVQVIKTVSQTPGCIGCPMRRFNEKFVSPQRPNDPACDLNRLVIAEAPGEKESEKGQPLVGPAGQVFDSLLEKAGIPRDGLTIINCLNCRPPHNVFPTDSKARTYINKEDAQIAVDHCIKHHVDPVLRERNWARVDLLGVKSLRFVARKKGGISEWRGSRVPIQRGGLDPVVGVPIYHPSYLARWGQSKKPVTVIDLKSGPGQPPRFGN